MSRLLRHDAFVLSVSHDLNTYIRFLEEHDCRSELCDVMLGELSHLLRHLKAAAGFPDQLILRTLGLLELAGRTRDYLALVYASVERFLSVSSSASAPAPPQAPASPPRMSSTRPAALSQPPYLTSSFIATGPFHPPRAVQSSVRPVFTDAPADTPVDAPADCSSITLSHGPAPSHSQNRVPTPVSAPSEAPAAETHNLSTDASLSQDKICPIILAGIYLEFVRGNAASARRLARAIIPLHKGASITCNEFLDLEFRHGSLLEGFSFMVSFIHQTGTTYSPLLLRYLEVALHLFTHNDYVASFVAGYVNSRLPLDSRWKASVMTALYYARTGDAAGLDAALCQALSEAKPGIHWRILVFAAQLCYTTKDYAECLGKYEAAYICAPDRHKPHILTLIAQVTEAHGDYDRAKSILKNALAVHVKDQRLPVEYLYTLQRCSDCERGSAAAAALLSSDKHRSNGKLWATFVSITYARSLRRVPRRVGQALRHCPKSADVWVEVARMLLNPLFSCFSLRDAEASLARAIFYTPQYGDSYVELLRVMLIRYFVLQEDTVPAVLHIISRCLEAKPSYGRTWNYCKTGAAACGLASSSGLTGDISACRSIMNNALLLVAEGVFHFMRLYARACARRRACTGLDALLTQVLSQDDLLNRSLLRSLTRETSAEGLAFLLSSAVPAYNSLFRRVSMGSLPLGSAERRKLIVSPETLV